MNEFRLRFNKIIKDKNMLHSYLSQKYGEEASEGELLVRRGKGYIVVLIDKDFPRVDLGDQAQYLVPCERAIKIKNLLQMVKSKILNKETMKVNALIKKFGSFGNDKYFHAFAPGFSSVNLFLTPLDHSRQYRHPQRLTSLHLP